MITGRPVLKLCLTTMIGDSADLAGRRRSLPGAVTAAVLLSWAGQQTRGAPYRWTPAAIRRAWRTP